MDRGSKTAERSEQESGIRKVVRGISKGVLPVIVLAVGFYTSSYLSSSTPKARRIPKKKNAPMVQTVKAAIGNHATVISAMGTVKPARQIDLRPQVSGQVISVSDNMLPGGHFISGDTLFQLDAREYQLALRQLKNGISQAENELEIEQGNQIVAARELELLGEQVSNKEKRLMLRMPQLQSLKNALETAQAKRDQAQLDLERTTLKAPFNGIVQSRDANLGSWLAGGTKVATLVGTDSFWVEVSVPEEQLKWIHVPKDKEEKGSLVKIYNFSSWGKEQYREGRVIQLLPTLETRGRMARLLIETEDPLSLQAVNEGQPKLLIGSFVRALIEGNSAEGTMEITRDYLHDGNKLWVYNPDGTLNIRKVDIIFEAQDSVLIKGAISEQDELIVSNLSSPVDGMKIVKQGEKRAQEKIREEAVKQEGKSPGGDSKTKGDS
ncbi:MAG: hypothetical protein CSA32_01640 [Desulfobulbus propionicus]|nr:MAG: hypothetical protein CSA32_01640 [Desulfobulbus propionicus]